MSPENNRYDILFEPLAIGPVVARNRFFQVPHCNGGGYRDPSAVAKMRNIKAQGGWAVVNTEQAEIHPTSEITPFIELRIWDDHDMPMLNRITDAIHEHDALAGIELCYNGMNGPNLHSREVPMGPMAIPIATFTNGEVTGIIARLTVNFINAFTTIGEPRKFEPVGQNRTPCRGRDSQSLALERKCL